MARQFVEKTITFQRTVTQEQELVVKVPPELTGKLAEEYAQALAWKRLDEQGWENVMDDEGQSNPMIIPNRGAKAS